MINTVIQINSPQFYMRPFKISDAPEVQQFLAHNKSYMLGWIPWAKDEPESVQVKREKIRQWTAAFHLDEKYTYGIYDPTQHNLIGIQYLFTRQGPGILEIGYIIGQEYAGRGLGTLTSYALTKLAFELLKPEKMAIICDHLNIPSKKIPEKLGYTEESVITSVNRNEQGNRIQLSTWVMFPEQFSPNEKYEPIEFVHEDGWN